MTVQGANRYALLGENIQPCSSESDQSTSKASNSYRETRPRVPQGKKTPITTLVFRDNKQHTVRNRPADEHYYHNDHESSKFGTLKDSASSDDKEKVSNPLEYWCGVCQRKLADKPTLLSHIKQLPNHQSYCNLCKRVFKDRNGLRNHLDNAPEHDIFCNLCLSAFKNKWGLRNHFENNYSVGHEFVCLVCLKGFKSCNQMEAHLRTAQKHVQCNTCQRMFRSQDERDEHWIKTAKHKHCMQPGCDFDAPNLKVLDEHLKNDHFQCEGCRMIFASQTKLTAHTGGCSLALPCGQCGNLLTGKDNLVAHQKACFACLECNYHTSHEGNYQIHMTKHTSAVLTCWACDIPMRMESSLVNHLESGKCPNFVDPVVLLQTLGRWWYSPLYMDLDLHAQMRTSRIDMRVMQLWIAGGSIHPFICRAPGCEKTFAHFSSLVLHVESQACEWNTAMLGLEMLKKEVLQGLGKRMAFHN